MVSHCAMNHEVALSLFTVQCIHTHDLAYCDRNSTCQPSQHFKKLVHIWKKSLNLQYCMKITRTERKSVTGIEVGGVYLVSSK